MAKNTIQKEFEFAEIINLQLQI